MKVRWSRRALADLERILERIAADKEEAAQKFAQAVRTSVDGLSDFPFLGRPGADADTRELVVHKNYLVTYHVRAEEIQVLQVWHVARNRPRGNG
jgi:toxin ParE1/3/4